MMPEKDEKIDYAALIKRHPWIIAKNQNCIISPDSDGLLCGLFMSEYLGWNIAGFYDGKILILKNGLSCNDCIFLDMEIFRKNVRSLGHHMVLYNKDTSQLPENWDEFSNCIQPNNLRGHDAHHNFREKYPFGSIHLLLGILGSTRKIEIKASAICPLVYTDGTFKNLFNYPENCLGWLKYLGADNKESPLNAVFYNEHYSILSLMLALQEFFSDLKHMNDGKRGADKLKISNSKGMPVNLKKSDGRYSFEAHAKNVGEKFLEVLSGLTGWRYAPKKWAWGSFSLYRFSKGNIRPGNKSYRELMQKHPVSLAMTSSLAIEYTLETPDNLP